MKTTKHLGIWMDHSKDNHHFDKIKIGVKPADKMTENQQHAFVREYFKPD